MYRIPISTPASNDLKDRERTCWDNPDQQIIDKSIDHWREKLKTVVRLNGGRTEQLFWLSGLIAVVLLWSMQSCVLPLCIEHYDGAVTKSKSSK